MGVRYERCSRRARHRNLFEQVVDFSIENVAGGLRGRGRATLDLQSRRPEAITPMNLALANRCQKLWRQLTRDTAARGY